jgi:hypothetical protein
MPNRCFTDDGEKSGQWGDSTTRVGLLPSEALPRLSEEVITEIARLFQAHLELLRLQRLYRHLQATQESRCPADVARDDLSQQAWDFFGNEPGVRELLQSLSDYQQEVTAMRRSLISEP